MRQAQYPNSNGYPTYYNNHLPFAPALQPNPNRQHPFNWMRPAFPRGCPYCGLQFMSFYKLGGHMTAHRREIRESNRQVLVSLAGQNQELAPPRNQGFQRREEAVNGSFIIPSTDAPFVPLGVLEPRIDLGLRCPRTLDLLGLGRQQLQGEDDDNSEKTITDSDDPVDGEDDLDLSLEWKNKKIKI